MFLRGCGLPEAWRGQRGWTIAEAGFGTGLNFLTAWQAWRSDESRPALLHYFSVEAHPAPVAELLRSGTQAGLLPLAQQLASQWTALGPGVHRLAFEQGRVLLTLAVGDARELLKKQRFVADSLFLGSSDSTADAASLKAWARLCRRDAGVVASPVAGTARSVLAECGFQLAPASDDDSQQPSLRGRYAPTWTPRHAPPQRRAPGRCIVVGGGLSGAAAAASLARRGWRVEVRDAAAQPAAGASGLPAGLCAPHLSPDDTLLSRLTRAGIRITLQQAREHLREGEDYAVTGVLHQPPGGTAHALPDAGWIKPAALVRAWLNHPAITWRGNTPVHDVDALDADLVVLAAAHATAALARGALALHPVRGQVTWGEGPPAHAPNVPVNGHGHFLPAVPLEGSTHWITGSTYGRGDARSDLRPEDDAANLERLRLLLPDVAADVAPQFAAGAVRSWAGVRCVTADRRPLLGPLSPRVWVCTAMGSRGLSFAALCGELLAARWHGEPLPLAPALAAALDLQRQIGRQAAPDLLGQL